MKKDFLKIIALVLLTTFVFQNCDDKNDSTADLTPDNMNNLIVLGLYGKVKSVVETEYSATWDIEAKKVAVPSDFSYRSTKEFNEQGFVTSAKDESYRTTFTIATGGKSATAKKELYVEEGRTYTFDGKNRPIKSVQKSSRSSSTPQLKIKDGDDERIVSYNENYFTTVSDDERNIKEIKVKDEFNVTIIGIVNDDEYTTTTNYVYDDANKACKATGVKKRGTVTTDSTVFTYKLLANGRIDESNGEGISYNVSTAASKPKRKIQVVSEKDDKGNTTLRYSLGIPYKEDETLNEARTNVDSYTKIEYQYWQ